MRASQSYSFQVIAVLWAMLIAPSRLYAQQVDYVEVDPGQVLVDTSRHPVGVNLDWELDNPAHRTQPAPPLAQTLAEMGATYLRYPGGEEANYFLWSVPPFTQPNSSLSLPSRYSRRAKDPYSFDQFMADCQSVHCTPNIVVAQRPYLDTAAAVHPSRQDLIDTAAAWVRYARQKKADIRYWEIGNEFYIDNTGASGPKQALGPSITEPNYIQDVRDFSRAMKSEDPAALIGANGHFKTDFEGLLKYDAANLDFLVVHTYPAAQLTISQYRQTRDLSEVETLLGRAEMALQESALSSLEKARIHIAVTETNAGNFKADPQGITDPGPRRQSNSIFEAVVLADTLGQILKHPKVDFVEVWTDHWEDGHFLGHFPPDGVSVLDNSNGITPRARAIAIWGNFLLEQMVRAEVVSRDTLIQVFAEYDQHRGTLNVILLNKDDKPHRVDVGLGNYNAGLSSADRAVFSGASMFDTAPTYRKGDPVTVRGNRFSVDMPGPSIEVVTLQGMSRSGLNRVADPGFEDPSLASWEPLAGKPAISQIARSGVHSLRLPAGASVRQSLVSSLPSGAACVLRAWEVSENSQAPPVGIQLAGVNGRKQWFRSSQAHAPDFSQSEIKFRVPKGGIRNASIRLSNPSGSQADAYVDDLALTCAP